jgi:hypothetical protein
VSSAIRQRTRNGVLGVEEKKNGIDLREQYNAVRMELAAPRRDIGHFGAKTAETGALWRASDMAQDHLSRTSPTNRNEIADSATYNKSC